MGLAMWKTLRRRFSIPKGRSQLSKTPGCPSATAASGNHNRPYAVAPAADEPRAPVRDDECHLSGIAMFRSLNPGQSVFARHGGRWSGRSRRKALTGDSRSGRRAGAAQAPGKKIGGPPSPHTIALGHLSRIGLAPGAGTPKDKADMRESGIPEPHRRPVVELDVEAVAPVLGDDHSPLPSGLWVFAIHATRRLPPSIVQAASAESGMLRNEGDQVSTNGISSPVETTIIWEIMELSVADRWPPDR